MHRDVRAFVVGRALLRVGVGNAALSPPILGDRGSGMLMIVVPVLETTRAWACGR